MRGLNRRFVLTGGPGAGKTTLLVAMQARGYTCMPDTARALIRDRLEAGLSPRPPLSEFAAEILNADLANYRKADSGDKAVLFDRGVVDALGMLKQHGVLAESGQNEYLSSYPYNRKVLLFPPWQDIYRTDSERDQSFEEAVEVFDSVSRWYTICGYELVNVPFGSLAERADFVEKFILSALADDPQ